LLEWGIWIVVGLVAWTSVSVAVSMFIGALAALGARPDATLQDRRIRAVLTAMEPPDAGSESHATGLPGAPAESEDFAPPAERPRKRVLIVDDDPALRLLVRTTLGADEFQVEEASSAEQASALARFWRPDIVVLDVGLPGLSGLEWCSELKRSGLVEANVILLTGADTTVEAARAAGADALLRKPFSPLDLIGLIDRHAIRITLPEAGPREQDAGEQLLVYARDLNCLLQVEREQRRLLQVAYRQTVAALANALEAKDPATGTHSLRVQRYALALTDAVDRSLLDDPSVEYGYLLHDVGKIGIPGDVLNKPGPLSEHERRLMQRHPQLGAEILREITLLEGEGMGVVRSHHERWDGNGYPDGLARDEIPLGARIFAVADAIDAITSDRPYRRAQPWQSAVSELQACRNSQFDPRIVDVFAACEPRFRRLHDELAAAA
jgi:response regulator RpfG family c-di-GMP phosphodiesterase